MKSLAIVLSITLASVLLLGAPASAQFLGDPDQLVYKPVNPCRIVDTRFAVGAFGPQDVRFYRVYGNVTAQNGANAANKYPNACPAPRGEPSAVAINVTAVPNQGASGWLTVQPGFLASQILEASMVNFTAGENVANQGAVRTRVGTAGQPDVKIFASAATHVVVDVAGYYYDIEDVFIDEDFQIDTGAIIAPDTTLKFLVTPAVVEVTRLNQNIFVVSHKPMGSVAVNGALNLNISICYDTPGIGITRVGTIAAGIRVAQFTMVPIGLSAMIPDLPVATYDVGLCGQTTAGQVARWNRNARGYTTAFVVEDKQ